MAQWENVLAEYRFERLLNDSNVASVYMAVHVSSNCPVAIKVYNGKECQDNKSHLMLERELKTMMKLDYPLVVQMYDFFVFDDDSFIVMEYLENGTLLNYVNDAECISEQEARRFFAQIISALDYLHNEKGVVHRDIKPENVLLDRNNNIRIIDFGQSNTITKDSPLLSTSCGSLSYVSPEILLGYKYATGTDIWSTGVLLYAILASRLPFEDENILCLVNKIVISDPEYPASFSPMLIDLIDRMLTKSPEKRITLEEIKSHPWFLNKLLDVHVKYDFSVLDKFRHSKVLDSDIIKEMEDQGYYTKSLASDIVHGRMTFSVAVYKLLAREKAKTLLGSVSDRVESRVEKNGRVLLPPKARPIIFRPRRNSEVSQFSSLRTPIRSIRLTSLEGRRGSQGNVGLSVNGIVHPFQSNKAAFEAIRIGFK